MKQYITLFISLVCIVVFTGCNKTAPHPGSRDLSKLIDAITQDDITAVNVEHIVGGQSEKFIAAGSNLDDLKAWVKDLQYQHKTFEKGNSPGDQDGGEVYSFEMAESNYPGFSYVINGRNNCYLLIKNEWYLVSNPSDPPIGNDDTEKIGADLIPMIMVKGELYYDTGKESEITGRCGVSDGEITSSVDSSEIPAEDNQSNFGEGYEYQFWPVDRIEVFINDKWMVFEKWSGDETLPVEYSSIELNLIGGEYRAIWKESYNYDTPILIDNLTDLTDFLKNHPAQSTNEDTLLQNYNDEFFKHSVVYAYIKSEGSGSIKLKAKKAGLDGDKLNLFMERIVPAEGTDDMATLICLFGINRDDNKSVKSAAGIITEGSMIADEVTYNFISADWPTYKDAEELVKASNVILLGKVTGISFQVLDDQTAQPPSEETEEWNRSLNTIYDVEVITSYKGDSIGNTKVRMLGGKENLYIKEQLTALGEDAEKGISIVKGMPEIEIGETYLLVLYQYKDTIPTLVNVDQSIYELHDPLAKDQYSFVSSKDIILYFGEDKWDAFQERGIIFE